MFAKNHTSALVLTILGTLLMLTALLTLTAKPAAFHDASEQAVSSPHSPGVPQTGASFGPDGRSDAAAVEHDDGLTEEGLDAHVTAADGATDTGTASGSETAAEGSTRAPGRLSIPALAFSASMNTMSPHDDIVNPPNGTDAFIIEGAGYGGLASEGMTTFVVLHSGSFRSKAVGNQLIDRDAGTTLVAVGDELDVAGFSYEVVETRIVSKHLLESIPDLWEHEDGKLVIFTCLQRPTGKSIDNVVIVAQRVRTP